MSVGFRNYLAAAFSARPWGMFVPPNWIGLAAFGLLGFLTPGFWLLGAGLECAYLYALASNPRFQRLVQGEDLLSTQQQWQARQQQQLAGLTAEDQRRYRALEQRCQGILEQQRNAETSPTDLRAQGEGLARLSWIYLRLLLTRQAILHILGGVDREEGEAGMKGRIARLENQIKSDKVNEDIRKSLQGQLEIVQQRMEKQREARDKVAFLTAEMMRIEEQVELIREQAAVATDPKTVSERIDQVTADLSGRSQWLREQQQIYGKVEDLLAEPPPMSVEPPKISQEEAK